MSEDFRQFFKRMTGVAYPGIPGELDHIKFDRIMNAIPAWCDHLRQEPPAMPSLKEREEAPFSGPEMRRLIAWFGYAHLADLLFVESDTDKTVGELRAQLRARFRREMADQ